MKKSTIYNAFLIGLPALAVLIAGSSGSVKIYDRAAGTYTYQSYFDLLPEGTFQLSTVLSVFLAITAVILAIAYVINNKTGCVKGVYLCTFASIFAAEIPTVMQTELLILPNLLVPILLVADCFMAYSRMKKPVEKEPKEKQGQRLPNRR